MRFVPYDELAGVPHVVVDGSAQAGTVLTLSHWPGSPTPPELGADLSAEIAFRYLDEPAFRVGADAVSNNHLDQDGLVSVYALTEPERASARRAQLVDVARAGDFGTFRDRDSARVAWTLAELAAGPDEPGYPELLALLPELLDHPARYRSLWAEEDAHLAATEAALAAGSITIEEDVDVDLAVVTVPVGLVPHRSHRFTRIGESVVHPSAIHNATDRFVVLSQQGRRYELTYRYETWVQYVSRRPRPRVDLAPLAAELSATEPGDARWEADPVGALDPTLRLVGAEESTIAPDTFRARVVRHLRTAPPAWDPYD